ncbi:sulfotransferase ssu-1 isoform X3 [Rhipicephalus sanguineus]|uniref:sulfotransferase ssu-1 isoform X3 n=1 Tax=Rhipicephalus sanguineus TaxID=34632 RepID=UPI0018946082|nr:sulfotransferase ssu-1 isoform X3 [Rhipicephalus sanguineus]
MAVRPLTRMIEGMPWSHYFPEQCVRSALAYQPLPGDVFIVSYPKCGTTWLQYIVYNIYSGGVPPRNREQFWDNTPFLEMRGAERSVLRSKPGAIKTHLPFDRQPYSPQAKYLYITRNPFDCCVSYYYHTKHLPGYCFGQGTFDDFFELFITGDLEYGDYFDHLLSWYAHRSDLNVLFLTYEELKGDTSAAVVKIAGFLGDEYAAKLRREPALVGRILEAAALGNMKKVFNSCDFPVTEEKAASLKEQERQAAASVEELVRRPMTGEFVRKGAVGDWKGHFSPVQVQRMLERIRVKTAGSDVMDLWKDIDIPR